MDYTREYRTCKLRLSTLITCYSFSPKEISARFRSLTYNDILDTHGVRLFEGVLSAPESIASRGRPNEIFTGLHNGSIVAVYGENYSKVKEVTRMGPVCSE